MTQAFNWRWMWIFTLSALLGVFAYYAYLLNGFTTHPGNTDFLTFYLTSELHHQGKPVYEVMHLSFPVGERYVQDSSGMWVKQIQQQAVEKINFNPPLFTWLMLPFAHVQYVTGFVLFACLSVLFLLAGCALVIMTFANKFSWSKFFLLAAALLFYGPSRVNLMLGQLGFLLFFLLTLAFYLMRREKVYGAAIVFGVAAVIKFFVLLFLLYFVFQRRWRFALVFFAAFLIGLFLPLFEFDWQAYMRYFNFIYVGPGPQRLLIFYNGSLLSFFLRLKAMLFSDSAIPMQAFQHLSYLASAMLAVFYFYVTRQRSDKDAQFFYHFSLTCVCMFLLSPLGWNYYFMVLLFPFLYFFSALERSFYVVLIGLPLFIAMVVLDYFPMSLGGYGAFLDLAVTLGLLQIARIAHSSATQQ